MASWKYFEREVAKELCKQWDMTYGEDIVRTPSSGALYWKGDIYYKSERARKEIPFFVECKYQKTFRIDQIIHESPEIQSWMEKAKQQASDGYIPILVLSRPMYSRYVVLERTYIDESALFSRVDQFMPIILTPHYVVFELCHLRKITQFLKKE